MAALTDDTKVEEAVEKLVIFFQDKDEDTILDMLQDRGDMNVELQNAMLTDLKESYNTILKRVSRSISKEKREELKDTLNSRFLGIIHKISTETSFNESLKNKLIIFLLEKYRKKLLDENPDMSFYDFDSLRSQIQGEKTRINTKQAATEQENEKTIERIGILKNDVSNFEVLSLSELQRIKKFINNVSSTTATTRGTGEAIPSRAPTRNPSFEFDEQDAEINIGDAAFLIWNKKELYTNLLDILSQSKSQSKAEAEAAFIEEEPEAESSDMADVFKLNVDIIFSELNNYSIIQLKDMMRVLESLDNNTTNNVCKLFISHVINEKENGSSGGRKNKKTQKKKTAKKQNKRKSKTTKKQNKRKSKTTKKKR